MNYKFIQYCGIFFLGIYVCYEDKYQFIVCLDVVYYDIVVDFYLIEFKVRENSYIINRYFLLEFIFIFQLEKEYLFYGDLFIFLFVIKNYLQDFVFKKEEVEKVKVRLWRNLLNDIQIIYFLEVISKLGRFYVW